MTHKLTFAAAILSVSLLAGGAFAMQGMDKDMPMQGKHHMMMQQKMEKMEGLSDATKKLLGDTMKAKMESRKANKEGMKKYRDEMKALMAAETFDKKAFLAKKAEMNAMKTKKQAAHAESMANVFEKMTAKERQVWAKHFKKGRKGMCKGMMGSKGKSRGISAECPEPIKGKMSSCECPMDDEMSGKAK